MADMLSSLASRDWSALLRVLLQERGLICDFPWQTDIHAADVAIGREFLIQTAWGAPGQDTQLKLPDDTGQAEVKMLRHQRGKGVIWDGARAKGLHVQTDWTCLTDRVAQLHLTLVRQASRDDI